MNRMIDYPLLVFVFSLVTLRLSAQAGAYFRRRRQPENVDYDNLGIVLGASLTMLALIIGFSFSMSVARYDQRKSSEMTEAAAIGTEYVRADLLPTGDAARVHELLRKYLSQRILFYTTRNESQLQQVEISTTQLRADLWSAVRGPAALPSTPLGVQIALGMNDVLNSQIYTQAAWLNRIPSASWVLVAAIAIFCNFLFGYSARDTVKKVRHVFVLPLLVAIAFFLIADIDSPRGGVIRVQPQNLSLLYESLHAQ